MTTNTILLIVAAAFFALIAAVGVWLMARAYYAPRPPYAPLRREDEAMTDDEIARYRHDDDL